MTLKHCRSAARVFCTMASVTVLACSGGRRPPPPQPVPAQDAPAPLERPTLLQVDPGVAPELRVVVACSEADLRVATASVTWRGDRGQAAAHRVDFTPFKDGFDRGVFATVPADRGGKFEQVRKESDRGGGRPLELVGFPRESDRKDLISMEVRNLEPGVLYTVRIVRRTEKGLVPSPAVRVLAPICVADEKEGR